MKDRDYFYRKAKNSQKYDDWNIAKHLRNQVNLNIRKAKADFIHDELNSNKKDPKKFWRVINRVFPGKNKNKSKTNKITLKNDRNRTVMEQAVPGFINKYFINIGQKIAENNKKLQGAGTLANQQQQAVSIADEEEGFELQVIKEVDVYKEVATINIKKSSGFSGINSQVLKEAFRVLIPELTDILNMSIQTATFQNSWKCATVIPVPKTGDLSKVENYRPISLLPLPGKILEKIIHTQLETELESSDFFKNYQHGFCKNRSTTHAILQLINQINYKMDKKCSYGSRLH